jgi:hypothetical protein
MQSNVWLLLASVVLRKKNIISTTEFKAHFKLSVLQVEHVWKLYHKSYPHSNAKHFLWILHFMKTTDTNCVDIAAFLGTNTQTLLLNVTNTLQQMRKILPEVLLFVARISHSTSIRFSFNFVVQLFKKIF